ncbi:hypothetical protein CVO74_03840 [Xanthomonas prunicola]|uniref:Uncharacterized protein n=1 Tax=Xanthomonas prunicola TaxID=2053930 RepID=A0A2N3RND3_9XANT|nr:hypothetical protein XpruCFBP8353_02620 [Xanthomonas prunicola]PKV18297.1 hypothetical protein XpruCFBP8354_02620 [Xanthomonas prunicola]PKV22392.1 hypothetical protein CVO74_03840 [Xanthomonas prunicola]
MHRLKRLAQLAAGVCRAKGRQSEILTADSLHIGSFLTATSRVLTCALQRAHSSGGCCIEACNRHHDFPTFYRRSDARVMCARHRWGAMVGRVRRQMTGANRRRLSGAWAMRKY